MDKKLAKLEGMAGSSVNATPTERDVSGECESTIVSEGFKGGTSGAPIMPRDAVSRTANVERNGAQKWVKECVDNLTQLGVDKKLAKLEGYPHGEGCLG